MRHLRLRAPSTLFFFVFFLIFIFSAGNVLAQSKSSSNSSISDNDGSKFTMLLQTEKRAIAALEDKIAGWDFIILEIDKILAEVQSLDKESISKEILLVSGSVVINDDVTKEDYIRQLKKVEQKSRVLYNRISMKQYINKFSTSLEKKWGPELSNTPFIGYLNFLQDFWNFDYQVTDNEQYFTYDNFKHCNYYAYEDDAEIKLTDCLETLKSFISYFDDYKNQFIKYFNEQKNKASERKTLLVSEAKRRQEAILASEEELKRVNALKAAQAKARTIIDPSAERLILYTLIAWGVIIIVAVTGVLLVTHWRMRTAAEPLEFSFALFLQIVTVFLLTATILILGIAGKIDAEALAALIGGISGYVLGRLSTASGKGDKVTTY